MADENLRQTTADELLKSIKKAAEDNFVCGQLETLARAYSLVVEGMPKGPSSRSGQVM